MDTPENKENLQATSPGTPPPEQQIQRLKATIDELHAEFGEKRAKFRNMFIEKEQELDEERKLRTKYENENRILQEECQNTEKLKNDVQKAAKLRHEMEEEWSQLAEQFQTKLTFLEEQLSTYEVVVQELNNTCQQSLVEMEKEVRKLSLERHDIQKNIERLEFENDNLQGKHVAHSEMLQNEYISLPNSVMELHEMVLRLKEELISVKIGKEQIEGEVRFLRDRVHMEEEEKKTIEESLMTEITELRTQLKEQTSHAHSEKSRLQKTVADLNAKMMNSESHLGKIAELQKSNEELIVQKEQAEKELAEVVAKSNTLRKELSNSEDLQRDLIALSKSLQMGLESIRQAETEVRWQYPDDIKQCNACKKSLADNKDKFNCCHCGRIFCKASCVNRTVRRGARDYNVCDFCHTLLAHDSAPYFSTEAPKSPD